MLQEIDFSIANIPLGWFEYDTESYDSLLSVCPYEVTRINQNIKKYCIVEETFGDRRLSTHLLHGIDKLVEIILHTLVDRDSFIKEGLQTSEISKSFKVKIFDKTHLEEDVRGLALPTWLLAISDFPLQSFLNLTTKFKELQDIFDNFTLDSSLIKSKILSILNLDRFGHFGIDESEFVKLIDDSLKTLSTVSSLTTTTVLTNQTKDDENHHHNISVCDVLDVLSRLMERIGWEVGRFQRLLNVEGRMSWGTYKDDLGDHCNAHPNNFIVIFPTPSLHPFSVNNDKDINHESLDNKEWKTFLAPLDFDMAFSFEDFNPLPSSNVDVTNNKEEIFKSLMEMELQSQILSLCGGDFNSGVSQNKIDKVKMEIDDFHVLGDYLQKALRETLYCGFMSGFSPLTRKKDNDILVDSSETRILDISKMKDQCYAVIQIALLLTLDEKA